MQLRIGDKVRTATGVARVVSLGKTKSGMLRVCVRDQDSGERRWLGVSEFTAEFRPESEAVKNLAELLKRNAA